MAKRENEKDLLAAPQEQAGNAHRPRQRRRGGYQRQSIGEAIAKSFIRSIASSLGRMLARAISGRTR
jgi:Bacterial protein of unknown function (DUF853)